METILDKYIKPLNPKHQTKRKITYQKSKKSIYNPKGV